MTSTTNEPLPLAAERVREVQDLGGPMNKVTPRPCNCESKLFAAECELRTKAKKRPDDTGYSLAVNCLVRVRAQHCKPCVACRSAEYQAVRRA